MHYHPLKGMQEQTTSMDRFCDALEWAAGEMESTEEELQSMVQRNLEMEMLIQQQFGHFEKFSEGVQSMGKTIENLQMILNLLDGSVRFIMQVDT